MGIIMDAIDSQIIRHRVTASEQEGLEMTKTDIRNFYKVPEGVRYRRTETYKNSPASSGVVSQGNGNYHYDIHLNNPGYSTGTPGFPVYENAQNNGAGILGTPGTWDDAVQDIIEAVKANFS